MQRSHMNSLMAAAALLALTAPVALSQRSSPQFSFPPPPNGALGSFGADAFGSSSQDLALTAALGQQAAAAQAQADQVASLQQVVASQQQVRPQAETNVSPAIVSRPTLVVQQQSPRQSLSSSSSGAASGSSSGQHTSNRHHQSASNLSPSSATSASSSASSSSSSSNSAGHHHRHHHQQSHAPASHQHQHPSNLQPQQTSQSLNAANNAAAAEAARKSEATAASLATSQGQAYRCPDPFGFFRHHKSCDKYWACENGTATLKLCGNGLNFDDSDPKRENCAYPFSVDCGADRTDLEAPISTPHCPRLYGLFADQANCRVFYSCWNGEASKYECPPGLAYDNEQRVCVWADLVERCDQSEVSDGFVCPDPTEADQPGHYTRHAHPTDCRKFNVCIEGVARPYGCSFGTVFNVDSLQCDEPENVSGCEKYYGDIDPKQAKKLARENAQTPQGGQQTAARSQSSQSASQRS